MISNARFADGAAAVLLRCDGNMRKVLCSANSRRARFRCGATNCGFLVSENGHLKNTLSKTVPVHAAQGVRQVVSDLDAEKNISHWVLHAGGQKVIDALAAEDSN